MTLLYPLFVLNAEVLGEALKQAPPPNGQEPLPQVPLEELYQPFFNKDGSKGKLPAPYIGLQALQDMFNIHGVPDALQHLAGQVPGQQLAGPLVAPEHALALQQIMQ